MKILLRLALLSLCGALGIILALQVAAVGSKPREAVASVAPAIAEEAATAETKSFVEASTAPRVSPATVIAQEPAPIAAVEPVEVATTPATELSPQVATTTIASSPSTNKSTLELKSPAAPSALGASSAPMPQVELPQPRTAMQIPPSANMPNYANSDLSRQSPDVTQLLQQATQLLGQAQQSSGGGAGGAGQDPASILMNLLSQQGGVAAGAGNVDAGNVLNQIQQLNQKTQQYRAAQQRAIDEAMGEPGLPSLGGPALPAPAGRAPAEAVPAVEALAPKPPAIADEGDGRLTIHSRDDDVRVLLEQLGEQAGLNIMASESVQGAITVNLQDVTVDEALRAVLKMSGFVSRREGGVLYVGTVADFDSLERSQDRVGTRVYRPNYLNAKELQTLLAPLLTPSTGKMSVTTPSAVGIATDNSNAGSDAIAQQDALVVQDYENVLAQIDQVYRELDRRPMQVSIEAVIVQVTLNDANTFGVDFQLLRDQQHVRFGWGNPRITPLDGAGTVNPATGGKIGEFTFDPGGLKFAFLDDSLGVFLDALETVGNVNVVASPKLLCLNKQKAEILIGSRLGYISTTTTQTFATQNVEFLDVGTQLRLRPFISADGVVRMEVHPELSTGNVKVEGGFTLPTKNLTEVTTNVMCPDGCTVIIGGLMREDIQTNSTQVPLLGSMPGIGPLFRNKADSIQRTEVLVLLTPRIIYDGEAAAEGAQYRRESDRIEASQFSDTIQIGTAHLARKRLQQAQQALNSGNRTAARRFAELARRHDPTNREVLQFFDLLDGAAAMPVRVPGGLQVETVVGDDAGPATVDAAEVPAWMLNDLGRTGAAEAIHPREPGMPGPNVDIHRPQAFNP